MSDGGLTLTAETMAMWVRIVDAGFDAMRKQIEHLQRERDDLEADLAELMDHVDQVPEQYWRLVSEQLPKEGERVLLTSGRTMAIGAMIGKRWQISKTSARNTGCRFQSCHL